MSILGDWAKYITDAFRAESSLAGELLDHATELGDTREALVGGVLARFLPRSYEIGRGEIVDREGNRSKQIDVVIARTDVPSLAMPGGSCLYFVEAVLATIEVKSTLNQGTLSEALDNCASVAALTPTLERESLLEFANKAGMPLDHDGNPDPTDPLQKARLDLLGRPAAMIFGFEGYTENHEDLANAILGWAQSRGNTPLRDYPTAIAAKGTFAIRNSPPWEAEPDAAMIVGRDPVPLRPFLVTLLGSLLQKMPASVDANGVRPHLLDYIGQIPVNDEDLKKVVWEPH